MKLPNSNKVIIPREKLTEYVLSETHSTGKFKAKYFGNLGFNGANIRFFQEALQKIVKSEEVKNEIVSPYGIKYILDGKISTPSGKIVQVRTIWIIEKEQNRPGFV